MYNIVLRVWIVLTQKLKPIRNFNTFKLGGKNSVEKLKNETADIYIFTSILSFKFVNANYKNNLNPSIYSVKHFNQSLLLCNIISCFITHQNMHAPFNLRTWYGFIHQKNT